MNLFYRSEIRQSFTNTVFLIPQHQSYPRIPCIPKANVNKCLLSARVLRRLKRNPFILFLSLTEIANAIGEGYQL
jgi:hypothetical protein